MSQLNINVIKQQLTPENWREVILGATALSMLAGLIVLFIFMSISPLTMSSPFTYGMGFVVCLGALFWLYLGKRNIALWNLFGGGWLALIYLSLQDGSVDSPMIIAAIVVSIMLYGISGRPFHVAIFGGLCIASTLCLTALFDSGVIPTSESIEWHTSIQLGFTYFAFLFPAMFVSYIVNSTISQFERQTRQLEKEIAHRAVAEKMLKAQQTELQLILDTVPVGICAMDRDGRILWSNRATETIVGYSSEAMQKMTWMDMTPAEDMPASVAFTEDVISGETPIGEMEKRAIRADGTLCEIRIRGTALRNEEGEFEANVMAIQDVTHEKQMVRDLQESEAWFRQVLDQAPDGFYVFDLTGKILDVNQIVCERINVPREQFIGKRIGDIDPDWSAERISVLFDQIGYNNPVTVMTHGKDLKSMKEWPVEARSVVIRHQNEPYFLTFARDVSERVGIEAALLESEVRYERLFDNAPVMIHAVDATATIMDVNAYWLTKMGYERDEVVGQSAAQFFTEESFERGAEVDFPKFFEEGFVTDLSYQMVTKSGEILDVLFSATNQIGEDGQFAFTLATIQDVTVQKRMEGMLRKNERRFRALVDSAPYGFFVYDENARLINVDLTACQMLGYTHSELVGKHVSEVDVEWSADTAPQHASLLGSGNMLTLDTTYRHKDGSHLPIQVQIVSLDEDDEWKYVGLARDVTDKRQAINALQISEEKYRNRYDSAPVMMHSANKDGILVDANHYWLDTMGYKKEEVIGHHMSKFHTASSLERMSREHLPFFSEHKYLQDAFYEFRRKDGTVLEGLVSSVLQHDAAGNPLYSLSTMIDVTEKNRIEQALRDSEKRYRDLFNNAPVMMHSGNADRILIDVNDCWLDVMGYEREEVIGQHISKFHTEASNRSTVETYRPRFIEDGHIENVPSQFVRKNGTVIETSLSSVSQRDEAGNHLYSLSAMRNVTETNRMGRALRDSEKKYRDLYNKTPVGMYSVDHEMHIVDVNNYWVEMIGYEREELIGRNPIEFLASESRSNAPEAQMIQLFQGDYVKDTPLQFLRKDGTVMDAHLSTTIEQDESGNLVRGFSTIVDVTEQKQAQDALSESEERYRDLYNNMPVLAHSAIVGSGELVAVNQYWLDKLGYKREEVIGRCLWDFFTPESAAYIKAEVITPFRVYRVVDNIPATLVTRTGEHIEALLSAVMRQKDGVQYSRTIMVDVTEQKRIEEAVRRKDAWFKDVINNMSDQFLVLDTESKITQVNDTFCSDTGYERDALIGVSIADLENRLDTSGINTHIEALYETGGSLTYTGVGRKKDGSHAPYESTAFVMDYEEEPHIVIFGRDVTERLAAEQALRESEERYRGIYENTPTGVYLADPERTMFDVNGSLIQMSGYTEEELLGRTPFSFLTEASQKQLKETHFPLYQEQGAMRDVELQLVRKDGAVIDILVYVTMLKDSDGNEWASLGEIFDVTERKRSEAEVRKKDKWFRNVIDNAADSYMVFNQDGHFVDFNQILCDSLGYTREELAQLTISDVDMAWSPEMMRQQGNEVRPGDAFLITGIHKRKDGTTFPVEIIANLLFEEGEPRFIGFARDITERLAAEAELRKQDVWFRNVIDNAADSYLVFDNDGHILDFNKRSCDSLGYTPEEMRQLMIADVETGLSLEQKREHVKTMKLGHAVLVTGTHKRKDGTTFPVEVITNILFDDDEPRFVAFARDISERIAGEKALQQSEKKYRELYNQTPVGMYSINDKGELVDVNDHWATMIGYTRDELIGRGALEFLTSESCERSINVEFPIFLEKGYVRDASHQFVKKNGEIMDVLLSGIMRQSEDGKPLSWLATIVDVTDQKRLQGEVRQNEERFKALFNNSSDLTAVLSPDGIILDINESIHKMLVDPVDTVLGRPIWRAADFDQRPKFQAGLKEMYDTVAKTGVEERKELSFFFKTINQQLYLDVILTPVFDSNNQIDMLLIESRDITQLVQTRNALGKAADEKTIMLQEIHHRVKNNLQIIMSILRMSQRQAKKAGEMAIASNYSEVLGRVRSMTLIHEQLYTDKGDMNEVNMQTYIRNLIYELLRTYRTQSQIDMQLNIGSLYMNIGVAIPCGMIINDAVSNALKYAFPDGVGTIVVGLSKQGQEIQLVVEDDGVGFPDSVQFPHKGSTGFRLIDLLAKQIGADVSLNTDKGTQYQFLFSE